MTQSWSQMKPTQTCEKLQFDLKNIFIVSSLINLVCFLGADHHPVHWLPRPDLFVLLCVLGGEGRRGWGGQDGLLQLRRCPVVGRGKAAELEWDGNTLFRGRKPFADVLYENIFRLLVFFFAMHILLPPWMPINFPNIAYVPEGPHHTYRKKRLFSPRARAAINNLHNALTSGVLTRKMEMAGPPWVDQLLTSLCCFFFFLFSSLVLRAACMCCCNTQHTGRCVDVFRA